MRKAIKITISVVLAIVVLFAAVVLVLGLIRVKPVDKFFGDFDRVEVYDLSQSERIPDIENLNMQERLTDAVKGTSYSVLNGIISGKASSQLRVNANEDGSARKFDAQQILSLKATENSYMLVIDYSEDKTIEKGKIADVDENIVFDKLYMFITDGPNEVVTVQIIPVDMDAVLSVSDDELDSEYYRAYDLRVNMYTAKLYNTIKEVIGDYNNLK